MAVLGKPNLSAFFTKTTEGLMAWAQTFRRDVLAVLTVHAFELNRSMSVDGVSDMTAPLRLRIYTIAEVPPVGTYPGGIIAVSNESGGYTIAFSDGTNWRRVQDRAIIS